MTDASLQNAEAPAPGGTNTNPSIGLGLNGVADWSTQLPFLDVFKSSRPWTAHLEGQWGGFEYERLRSEGFLDADGWLMDIPDGVSGVTAIMLTELPAAMTSAAGRYRMTFDGEGDFTLWGGVSNITRTGPNEYWFDYTPDGGSSVFLTIEDTKPGNYLRNISIVHESSLAAFEAGEIFNRDWIALIEDVRSVRFMDWMQTNNSDLAHWAERAEASDATWGGDAGVPLEIMIALANQTGTDPWFTIPHNADADFIRNFAETVLDQLDPSLKAHVEFSNEVWNWQFEQAQWAHREGQARWGTDVGDAWVQFYGMKAAEMAVIWRDVYGDQAEDRLNLVISVQTGWLGLETSVLDAAQWVAEGNDAPNLSFDSYAVTGYFDGGLGRDKAPVVKQWITESLSRAEQAADALGLTGAARTDHIAQHRYDHADALAIAELRDGSVTGNADGSLVALAGLFAYHKAQADARGLELIMYEGGTHVVGIGEWTNDAELAEFFIHLNYTAGMATLYGELMQSWKDAGGTLFNAFVDVGAPSKWGSWGGLRHLDDANPRWDALLAFNDANPGWWEERDPDAFGIDPADPILGTDEADSLSGAAGDDSLFGLGGNDLLNGQDGDDLLAGGEGDDVLTGGAGLDMATYGDAAAGIRVRLEITERQNTGGGGRDTLSGVENVSGSAFGDQITGDGLDNLLVDTLGGDDVLAGGAGDDWIHVERSIGMTVSAVRGDGGAGDDILSFDGKGRNSDSILFNGKDGDDQFEITDARLVTINAGAGQDTVVLDSLAGRWTIRLGPGRDTLVLADTDGDFRGSPNNRLLDFVAGDGASADVIDLSWYLAGGALTRLAPGANPFEDGHMRLVQSGSATLLQVDRNGGGDSYVTLLTFENSRASRFTAANFDGLDPAAAGPDAAQAAPSPDAAASAEPGNWLV
jgi:hypothetical protein